MSLGDLSIRPSNPKEAKARGAMIGAAFGDALGWPNEDRAQRVGKQEHSNQATSEFRGWKRRTGGRFSPVYEQIAPGDYSDDTQLILSTARALLGPEDWWRYLAFVELPFWLAYERGGGGASKRAAEMLLAGNEPWNNKRAEDTDRYFRAGGNGVAMRILPHSILRAGDPNFRELARDVITDGVCTHGHPRALVGALALARALWTSFRQNDTLPFGRLIEDLLTHSYEWSEQPTVDDRWPSWLSAAQRHHADRYDVVWRETVQEMIVLLEKSYEGIRLGALSVDRSILERLGCFNKKVSGAGTVSASAAIFLASRHAASPLNAVIQAAFAHGADTDTIAAMTGGLVGAISGLDWLPTSVERLQDLAYIDCMASRLVLGEKRDRKGTKVGRKTLLSFFERLERAGERSEISLPDGRIGHITAIEPLANRSQESIARRWAIAVAGGETVYVRRPVKTEKPRNRTADLPLLADREPAKNKPNIVVDKIGVSLAVRDLVASRYFYAEALLLPIARETKNYVNFADSVAIYENKDLANIASQDLHLLRELISLFIEVDDLDACYNRLASGRFETTGRLSEIHQRAGRKFFWCRDPDGYFVEVFGKE